MDVINKAFWLGMICGGMIGISVAIIVLALLL